MERQLLMSRKEACRKVGFEGVIAGRMSIREASRRLGLSYRHCRRSYRRYREVWEHKEDSLWHGP